jgi:hypothetical protein
VLCVRAGGTCAWHLEKNSSLEKRWGVQEKFKKRRRHTLIGEIVYKRHYKECPRNLSGIIG